MLSRITFKCILSLKSVFFLKKKLRACLIVILGSVFIMCLVVIIGNVYNIFNT